MKSIRFIMNDDNCSLRNQQKYPKSFDDEQGGILDVYDCEYQ